MNKVHRLLGLWTLLFSLAPGASTVVHDPNQSLNGLRNYLGAASFAATFGCGDTAAIQGFIVSCQDYSATTENNSMTCQSVTDPAGALVHQQVTNCTDSSISLLVDATGNTTNVTADDFTAAHNNTLELFLANLVDFTGYNGAEFTIDSITPTTYVFARSTPNPRSVDAMTVTGSFGQPGLKPFDVIITVTKNALGVAQIVRFRMENITWFLVNDFTGGHP